MKASILVLAAALLSAPALAQQNPPAPQFNDEQTWAMTLAQQIPADELATAAVSAEAANAPDPLIDLATKHGVTEPDWLKTRIAAQKLEHGPRGDGRQRHRRHDDVLVPVYWCPDNSWSCGTLPTSVRTELAAQSGKDVKYFLVAVPGVTMSFMPAQAYAIFLASMFGLNVERMTLFIGHNDPGVCGAAKDNETQELRRRVRLDAQDLGPRREQAPRAPVRLEHHRGPALARLRRRGPGRRPQRPAASSGPRPAAARRCSARARRRTRARRSARRSRPTTRCSRPRRGQAWVPIPGGGVRIDQDGEVLLKGPVLFSGYWRNLEATAGSMHGDWFATGDLGSLDAEGYLTITGRKKDILITSGGKNVSPSLLEDRLRSRPPVGQCMVIGDGRPYVAALITLEPEEMEHWLSLRRRPLRHAVLRTRQRPRAAVPAAGGGGLREQRRLARRVDSRLPADRGRVQRGERAAHPVA